MARTASLTAAVFVLIAGYLVGQDYRPSPSAEPPASSTAEPPAAKANAGRAFSTEPFATFTMGPDRMPFGTLSFGGKDYHCLLDTGTARTALNEPFRSALGNPVRRESGYEDYRLPAASIGSLQIPEGVLVTCHNFDNLARMCGWPVDGIVGMDILFQVALSLNYDDGVVVLHRPDFRPSGPAVSVAMPCMPWPFAMADVCGEECALMLDSGSSEEVSLRKALVDSLCKRDFATIYAEIIAAKWGRNEMNPAGLLSYVAAKGFRHSKVLFAQQREARWDGCLGRGFLARYNSTLRFASDEILLTKSKWHEAKWWPILRGMTIADLNGRRVVFAVNRGSPAFVAGIRPNDEIDVPPNFLESLDLWEALGPLTLEIRKPNEALFTPVRIGEEQWLPTEPLEAFIAQSLETMHVPGASVAVVSGGKVLFSKGFGLANVENETPATEHTAYPQLCESQAFLAAGIMLLAREGRLSLEDKVADRLPNIPEGWRKVTVHQLLCHSSGIRGYQTSLDEGQTTPPASDVLDQVAAAPLEFASGEQQAYSNTNHLLLALLIEKLAGRPYDQFLAERVLIPLGMTGTLNMGRAHNDSSRRYKWNDSEQRHVVNVEMVHPLNLSGFVSNVADLVKWEAALARRSLLDEATLNEMWSPALPDKPRSGYGYGWDFGSVNGHRLISSGGFSTHVARYVDDQMTVILLTNSVDARADTLAHEIAGFFLPEVRVRMRPIEDRDPATTDRLRNVVLQAQQGRVDNSRFAEEVSEQVAAGFKRLQEKIADAGKLDRFELVYDIRIVQGTGLAYRATFERRTVTVTCCLDVAGQIYSFDVE